MWRIGYVDTVNLRSRMPTAKIHQPTSGPWGPHHWWSSQWLTFGSQARTKPGNKRVLYENEPLLSLTYEISPCETRGRCSGGTSLPHKKKRKLHVNASAETRPRLRQDRHHRRRRPLYIGVDDDPLPLYTAGRPIQSPVAGHTSWHGIRSRGAEESRPSAATLAGPCWQQQQQQRQGDSSRRGRYLIVK